MLSVCENLQLGNGCLTSAETAEFLQSVKHGVQQLPESEELRIDSGETALFIAAELLVLQKCAKIAGISPLDRELGEILKVALHRIT